MNTLPVEITYYLNTVSNIVAQYLTNDQMTTLSALVIQLGDTLATIAAIEEFEYPQSE